MISPSFSSSLPLPLPLFCLLFIMLGIPVSLTTPEYEREFENCLDSMFKCGNITAGFPFHGGDREKECGHPDLELQCHDDITTMEIHGVRYRVLDIRPDRQILGISSEEVINKGICRPPFPDEDWILDSSVFTPIPGFARVTLFYDCRSPISPDLLSFPCNKNDDYSNVSVAIANNNNIHPARCSDSVNVSILQTSLESLRDNSSDWKEALKIGFEVQWTKNYSEACWKCNSSGGACGFDILKDQTFYCYCPPGTWSGLEGKECHPLPQPSSSENTNSRKFPTINRKFWETLAAKLLHMRSACLHQHILVANIKVQL